MRSLICVMLAGVLLGGATLAADDGHGRGRKHRGGYDNDDRGRYDRRDYRDDDRRDYRDHDRYDGRFSVREVRVIRDYYGPRYRPMPRGLRHKYYRDAYLPYGWHRRIVPFPVYVEREMVMLPPDCHRGFIDGHAVIYNSRGMVIDVAVVF